MSITIPSLGSLEAFAMIVDINGFTKMVDKSDGDLIAQFVRDVLQGGVEVVEKNEGQVVAFMGDAFLAVLPSADDARLACWNIGRDLDEQCEYISTHQKDFPKDWHYAKGGPSLKISLEYGWIDVSEIQSNFLGTQKLLIGTPINYAARISNAGEGNRCHIGPRAVEHPGLGDYVDMAPQIVPGKDGEGNYTYYKLDMSSIWVEGTREGGVDTYWG